MGQLLSKDVLYEPLKEISQRVRALQWPAPSSRVTHARVSTERASAHLCRRV